MLWVYSAAILFYNCDVVSICVHTNRVSPKPACVFSYVSKTLMCKRSQSLHTIDVLCLFPDIVLSISM